MKKVAALFLLLLSLTACTRVGDAVNPFGMGEDTQPAHTFADIRSLPESYGTYKNREQAAADGVVIVDHNDIYNQDRIDAFADNAATGIEDTVRIIRFTTEGDPIITDCHFKKGYFEVTEDDSRDSFSGSGGITARYYAYLLPDEEGNLVCTNWPDVWGPDYDCFPLESNAMTLFYAWEVSQKLAEQLTNLFEAATENAPAEFLSPDGKVLLRAVNRESELHLSVSGGGVTGNVLLGGGIVELADVAWTGNRTVAIVGVNDGGALRYATYDCETGIFQGWRAFEAAEHEDMLSSAKEMLSGLTGEYVGPGFGIRFASESLLVTNTENQTEDLQYKTVFIVSYSPREQTARQIKLYFDAFTGDYLGMTGLMDLSPTVFDSIDPIQVLTMDSYALAAGAAEATVTLLNAWDQDVTDAKEGWFLERWRGEGWYTLTDSDGEVAFSLKNGEEVNITLELSPLTPGYYRIVLPCLVGDDRRIFCVCFTAGGVGDFGLEDLPPGVTEAEDKTVRLWVSRDYGTDAEAVMYALKSKEGSGVFHTGCGAYLERKIGGQWRALPNRIQGFEAVGMDFGGEEAAAYETIYLSDYLLPLEPGRYRIVKDGWFEDGETAWICGEFYVTDTPEADYERTETEGLSMQVTSMSSLWEAGPILSSKIARYWIKVTVYNNSMGTVILDSNEVTGGSLSGVPNGATHAHNPVVEPNGEYTFTLRLFSRKADGEIDHWDDSGLFNEDGSVAEGDYEVRRKVYFTNGTYAWLTKTFYAREGRLYNELPTQDGAINTPVPVSADE